MKSLKFVLLPLALLAALPASAGPATDALVACVSDNTTGKDRKDLARWMFASMSVHPEMQEVARVTPAAREHASEAMGQLFTRLVTETCPTQFRAAKADGSQSFGVAFEALGKLAMQELMSNNDVRKSISGFEQFVDKKKVETVLGR